MVINLIMKIRAWAVIELLDHMKGNYGRHDMVIYWLIDHVFDRDGEIIRTCRKILTEMKRKECADNDGSTR